MTSYHAVHVVTLSFDDGFASSSLRTAEIFERHGLVAELNIVATGRYNLHGLDGEGWARSAATRSTGCSNASSNAAFVCCPSRPR